MRVLIALLAMTLNAAWGSDAHQNRPDFADLYQRVSESAFVVRATLVKMGNTPRRPAPKDIGTPTEFSSELVYTGGTLYTFDVKQILCQRADWFPSRTQAQPLKGPVYVLVPRVVEPLSEYGRQYAPESFAPGVEYLLFLKEDPNKQLSSIYELDGNRTYYRTLSGARGGVEMPSKERKGQPTDFVTPLVSAVTAMCDAVKPADPMAKKAQLIQVKYTADPAWRPAVDDALRALEVSPTKR